MIGNSVAERLTNARVAKGYNKRFVSKNLNIPYPTLCGYEYGRNEPPISTIVKLADFYGVTADELMRQEVDIEVTVQKKEEPPVTEEPKSDSSLTMKELIHFCDIAGFLKDGQQDISDSDLLFLKSIISACAEWFSEKDRMN